MTKPGTNRRGGQPLRASWRPAAESGEGPAHRRSRGGLGAAMRRYGWHGLSVVVLLALTALVVHEVGQQDAGAAATGAQPGPDGVVAAEEEPSEELPPPEATELPVTPVDVNVPTAELPNGGPFTPAGAGSWHIVAGTGPRVGGGGKLYTYTVEVEDGIDASAFGGDEAFARLIDQTLADPRGWTTGGRVSVQRVDSGNPTMRVSLSTPETVHRPDKCGYGIKYESSCYRRSEQRVLINLARWVRGATAFDGDILTYRQYAINHEVGHAFNNQHVGCGTEGALAPVMMQQTFGVSNNFVAELNRAVGNREPIAADGKTCKPNAWPNPQAKAAG
ncbi:MAG TPA: DUF3152 domain-containing protein [Actinophytocola sp.]|uniref:DUF3152 domain-containing protein n=1 Tax=Actinophytocola sp. TaxID=1872138 RepID=UPI002DBFAD13|nr:DUF3152 domain-containing protein [Actinophytocola sp.]HEU5469648.1 DUF3152 domain-containing protein [Actinophytocola sp.]